MREQQYTVYTYIWLFIPGFGSFWASTCALWIHSVPFGNMLKVSKIVPESISGTLNFKYFLREHAPPSPP